MTDRVVLTRWDGDPWNDVIPPLRWTMTVLDGVEEPMVSCGSAHLAFIPAHDVDAEGNISPSLLCRTPVGVGATECGWHVFAQMEGWTGGSRQAEA